MGLCTRQEAQFRSILKLCCVHSLEPKHQITISNLNVALWRRLNSAEKQQILAVWKENHVSKLRYGSVPLPLIKLFLLMDFLHLSQASTWSVLSRTGTRSLPNWQHLTGRLQAAPIVLHFVPHSLPSFIMRLLLGNTSSCL